MYALVKFSLLLTQMIACLEDGNEGTADRDDVDDGGDFEEEHVSIR